MTVVNAPDLLPSSIDTIIMQRFTPLGFISTFMEDFEKIKTPLLNALAGVTVALLPFPEEPSPLSASLIEDSNLATESLSIHSMAIQFFKKPTRLVSAGLFLYSAYKLYEAGKLEKSKICKRNEAIFLLANYLNYLREDLQSCTAELSQANPQEKELFDLLIKSFHLVMESFKTFESSSLEPTIPTQLRIEIEDVEKLLKTTHNLLWWKKYPPTKAPSNVNEYMTDKLQTTAAPIEFAKMFLDKTDPAEQKIEEKLTHLNHHLLALSQFESYPEALTCFDTDFHNLEQTLESAIKSIKSHFA